MTGAVVCMLHNSLKASYLSGIFLGVLTQLKSIYSSRRHHHEIVIIFFFLPPHVKVKKKYDNHIITSFVDVGDSRSSEERDAR